MSENKRRVLVVDDDAVIRDMAVDILSPEYEVMEAIDGQDGWEKARSWRPELVISDLMMPRMHGYELCKLLRSPEGLGGVKILVASSKPFATDKAQALAAGADDYIVKPFPINDLLDKVRKLLPRAPPVPPGAPRDRRGPPPPPPARPPPASRDAPLPV